jgi:hypothetical protein
VGLLLDLLLVDVSRLSKVIVLMCRCLMYVQVYFCCAVGLVFG